MADLAGTKKRKRSRKKHIDRPTHPDVQETSRKEPQKKEKAENSSVVPSQPEKCLGRLEKDVQPINGHYGEIRNPHERSRKTLVE